MIFKIWGFFGVFFKFISIENFIVDINTTKLFTNIY